MLRMTVAALLLVPIAGSAVAETWNCRNEAVEVTCSDGECTVSEAHTPMAVSVSLAGEMSVCAYSGCWEGRADSILMSGEYLTFHAADLKWSQSPTDAGIGCAATIDRQSRTGTIMVDNFAHPMTCERKAD